MSDEIHDEGIATETALNVDGDEKDWYDRIIESEDARDRKLVHIEDAIQRYAGPAWLGVKLEEWCNDPRNTAYGYVARFVADSALDKATVRVGGRRGAERDHWITALNLALAAWMRQTKFHSLIERVATTVCFTPNATVTYMGLHPAFHEADDPVWWPNVARLGLREFGYDCQAKSFEERRFSFHVASGEKEVLLEKAKEDAGKPDTDPSKEYWIAEAIEEMVTGGGFGRIGVEDPGYRKKTDVCWYVVYCPFEKVDRAHTSRLGFHGVIRTFAVSAAGGMLEIAEPRDYFGPRGGPHTLFGGYYVPDEAFELGPLTATWSQQRELNDIALANNMAARNWKRALVSNDEKFIQGIQKVGHDSAFYHKSFNPDRTSVFEYGGLSEQGMAQEARAQEQLDSVLGDSESLRGRASADTTATAERIAKIASQSRAWFPVKKLLDGAEDILMRVAHFMVSEKRVAVLLKETADDQAFVWLGGDRDESEAKERLKEIGFLPAGEEGEEPKAVYAMPKKKSKRSFFEELQPTIDLESVGRKPAEQLRQEGLELMAVVSQLAQLALTAPHARVRLLAETMAKKLGVSELPDMIDYELGRALAGKMIQAELQPETTPSKAEPRLGSDLGLPEQPRFRGGAAQGTPAPKPLSTSSTTPAAKPATVGGTNGRS